MSLILPTRKLIKKAIPIVLCAPLILPITAVKGKELGMFMPLMGVSVAGKYVAPPSLVPIYKGKCVKTTSTAAGTPISFTSQDIGTAHEQRIFIAGWVITDAAASNAIVVGGTTLDFMTFQNVTGTNILMAWMALPSSYGTTTTISYTSSIVQASFQLMYYVAYPSSATPLTINSTENGASGAAGSGSLATEVGGFAIGMWACNAVSGATGSLFAGTGTLVKDAEDSSTARGIAAFNVTGCDGNTLNIQADRTIGGSGWKAMCGMSWARSY